MERVLDKKIVYSNFFGSIFLTLFLLAIGAPTALASSVIFATGPVTSIGANGGVEVNVSASFTLDAITHKITVSLLNLEKDPGGVTQALSGIEFTLNNFTGSIAYSTPAATVTTESIQSSGVPNPPNSAAAAGWGFESVGTNSNVLTLCAICYNQNSVGPKGLIIGGPDPTTTGGATPTDTYTHAQGAIAGNNGHNPFILGSGDAYSGGPLGGLTSANTTPTWTLDVPTITASTGIVSVTFFFNTTYNTASTTDNNPITPEPGPIVLIISGLLMVGVARLAKRKREARAPGTAATEKLHTL
jgi:hypothetical protein